ncbi:glycosyltransferase [Marinobacter flavimaris]|uniref:Glycosyltransferase n=1 Tax=Marinobacter flavimaris TaxID=262076 RepID=A0A3D8H8E0_9GAMM|nr:glycosyltransferase [Marinobacter flavimaris]PPI79536.1 family 2 glycosyl transferase [Marinobacter flavimaris]RDU43004.1 glycosyltransferase [Marinobacter flavimaris]
MVIDFSFIIPCRNEEAFIEKCLQSIIQQEYPREKFEIIVVDNGSTDRSKEVARPYADKVVDALGVNVGEVRNIGASAAKGKLLAFIDADCTIDHQWLIRAKSLNNEDKKVVFGGGILLPNDATWVERHWLLEGPEGNCLPAELIGCSIVISEDQFTKAKGFDIRKKSGEDTDFSLRIREQQGTIKITRALNVTHLGNAKTIKSHIKRQAWHAQSYKVDIKSSIQDPVFILVIFQSAAIMAAIGSLAYQTPYLATLSISANLAIPAALTLKRYARSKCRDLRPKSLILAYALDCTYLIGRIIGLVGVART